MAFLAAVSLDFRHCQTVHADRGQGIADLFELEGLDDRHNDFFMCPAPAWARLQHAGRFWLRLRAGKGRGAGAAATRESNAVPNHPDCLTTCEFKAFWLGCHAVRHRRNAPLKA